MIKLKFDASSVPAGTAADKISAESLLEEVLDQIADEFVGRRPAKSSAAAADSADNEDGRGSGARS